MKAVSLSFRNGWVSSESDPALSATGSLAADEI